jgi:heat-inducible transcriptional repressor
MDQLDARKQTILRAVIFEYVRGAEPIGSEMLAAKYELGVKSATIRNELSDLSDMGFLEQPHTSAGRIPSDRGYRYFVDRLIVTQDLESQKKSKVKEATAEGDALQDLLSETTRVLSRLTHQLTAATIVRNQNLTIRSIVASALGPKQAIVVVVLSNGHVENRMVEVPAELTLTELGQVNEWLANNLTGLTLRGAARAKPSVPEERGSKLLGVVTTALKSISKEVNKVSVTTQGEEFLFGQPEFNKDTQALAEMLDQLKESELLADAIQTPSDAPQMVTIGREHRYPQLQKLSLIRQSFYVGENEAGVIAIIGPTRMAYETSIPLVSFTARALSESLTRFLG